MNGFTQENLQHKSKLANISSAVSNIVSGALGDCWPGIQLYYPPIKYTPSTGVYEDMTSAALRMKKHAHHTNAHTLIFDLEDGCRQKEMSRDLLRLELPLLKRFCDDNKKQGP